MKIDFSLCASLGGTLSEVPLTLDGIVPVSLNKVDFYSGLFAHGNDGDGSVDVGGGLVALHGADLELAEVGEALAVV